MIKMHIADIIKKSKKSILLLGPRQTGKSTLIKSIKPDLEIDLTDQQVYLDHLKDAVPLKDSPKAQVAASFNIQNFIFSMSGSSMAVWQTLKPLLTAWDFCSNI